MKRHHVAAAVLLVSVPVASYSAAVSEAAKDWQLKSLKGITSVKYAVSWDPSKKISRAMAAGLEGVGVPVKGIDFKDGDLPVLAKDEALVTASMDDKEKGQAWVGVYVQQNSQLARTPGIAYNAQTYRIGKLVPKNKSDDALKDLIAQFVADFKAQNKK